MKTTKRIMVFDDDESILDFCQMYFEGKGYDLKVHVNCENAATKVKEFNPGLIFMDSWIPLHGGAAAVKEIKSDSTISSIPIIMFSANNNLEKVAIEAGADGYLEKPFELDELDAIVAKYLEN